MESVLIEISSDHLTARLSEYLIGLELAGSRLYYLGEKILISGDSQMSLVYETSLVSLIASVKMLADNDISLNSLIAIFITRE